jgi:23S rRNA-intervening sequence protein
MAFAFEKLLVYQKAIDFSDRTCQISQTFPRGFYFLVDQLNRAALSIAANIAEGNGRFTKPDRKNFFGIARGSVQECVPLLGTRSTTWADRRRRPCDVESRSGRDRSNALRVDQFFGQARRGLTER